MKMHLKCLPNPQFLRYRNVTYHFGIPSLNVIVWYGVKSLKTYIYVFGRESVNRLVKMVILTPWSTQSDKRFRRYSICGWKQQQHIVFKKYFYFKLIGWSRRSFWHLDQLNQTNCLGDSIYGWKQQQQQQQIVLKNIFTLN